jgi:dCMP deaminase
VNTEKQYRWDRHFLDLAAAHAKMSKDPSTKVGCIIVGPENEIRSGGFNGLPRNVADTDERLNDRDKKLELVVHAEMNAIMAAALVGTPLRGSTMYIVATDKSGKIWGGPPCIRCAVHVIQAGITQVVTVPKKDVPSSWHDSLIKSEEILIEANIGLRFVCT